MDNNNNNNIEVVETKRCCYCNSEVSTERGVQWGRYFYCDRCFKNNKCMVDSYHNPSIDTSFKRSKKDSGTENLYLGIELEITKDIYGRCTQSEHIDNVFYIRKNFKELGLNFETDSSIGDGMEIVTQPMTYKYFKENQDKFKSIFEYLPIESKIHKYQEDYYKAINNSHKNGNSNEFINFMLKMIDETLEEAINNSYKPITNEQLNINKLLSVLEPNVPLSANEIMNKLGIKSKETLRNGYIDPAIKQELIKLTIPDKITSKNQKYYKD